MKAIFDNSYSPMWHDFTRISAQRQTVKLVRELACSNCEVKIYDLHHESAAEKEKIKQYGIHRIPAVVVNGKLAECCSSQQPVSREMLVAAGIGQG